MKFNDLQIMNGCRARWLTQVEGEEYQTLLEIFSQEAQMKLHLPGFRQGKAPLAVVAAAYGENFYADAAVSLLPAIYNESVTQQDLSPVADPSFLVIACDKDMLCVRMEVDVYPQVTLGRYKGLEAYRPSDAVSDEEMAREVEKFRDNHREVLVTDQQRGDDDLVYFSVSGTVAGADAPGVVLTGVLQRFDAPDVFPALKEQLRGRRTGETFRYEAEVPAEDARPDLAGKRITLDIRVDEVKERRLRPVNDALFVPAYASMADFLEKRRAELEKVRRLQADDVFEKNLRRALCDQVEANIPNSMIQQETGKRLANISSNLRDSGGIVRFLADNGMTAEELEATVRAQAVEELKFLLATDAVAAAEGIDDEIDDRRERKAFAIVKEYARVLTEEKG